MFLHTVSSQSLSLRELGFAVAALVKRACEAGNWPDDHLIPDLHTFNSVRDFYETIFNLLVLLAASSAFVARTLLNLVVSS